MKKFSRWASPCIKIVAASTIINTGKGSLKKVTPVKDFPCPALIGTTCTLPSANGLLSGQSDGVCGTKAPFDFVLDARVT